MEQRQQGIGGHGEKKRLDISAILDASVFRHRKPQKPKNKKPKGMNAVHTFLFGISSSQQQARHILNPKHAPKRTLGHTHTHTDTDTHTHGHTHTHTHTHGHTHTDTHTHTHTEEGA